MREHCYARSLPNLLVLILPVCLSPHTPHTPHTLVFDPSYAPGPSPIHSTSSHCSPPPLPSTPPPLHPSIPTQARDPFTLVVALDADGKATGDLFLDDGSSFAFKRGQYVHRCERGGGRGQYVHRWGGRDMG